jgi:hypothetical protein
LNACGLNGQNVDDATFNPAVSFFHAAVVTFEGEKPAA